MMPDAYIPFDIQSEIIKRVLPVKSLLRFRSVSKQWKSLIESSEFIADHSVNQSHHHHLLVRYKLDSEYKYVSVVDDDDSFHQNNESSPVVPPSDNLVDYGFMLDSSHGLVCLYGCMDQKIMVVIWNPSIRKSFGIELSQSLTTLGFGVCLKTNDLKIVTITRSNEIEPVNSSKAEVFTLSSRAWRSISLNIHFSTTTLFRRRNVAVDGVIYWAIHDVSNVDRDRIISFDLVSEEFGEVDLPDSLARGKVCIYKHNESLAVLHFNGDDDKPKMPCYVWMLMPENRFEKVFSIDVETFKFCKLYGVVGFRKNGQPIRERPCGDDGSLGTILEAYDPSTKHICDLGIVTDGGFEHAKINSYTESLFLLNNHTDYIFQG